MDDLFGTSPNDAASDPQADFLARERAALGSDASTFDHTAQSAGVGGDKDFEQSANAFPDLEGGSDDGLEAFSTPNAVSSSSTSNANNSAVPHQVSVTGTNEFAQFEQEYPEIELPSNESPHSNGNGFNDAAPVSNYANPYSQPTSFVQPPQPKDDESEFIQTWRTKQAQEIAEREEQAERKKEETIAKARAQIDSFYKDYNSKKEKSISQNKHDEEQFKAQLTDDLSKGTTWDRICQLVDLNDSRSKTATKSKQDLSRFKDVLLSLKREGENAPGAGGY
ncbi:clathrin light chain CLC1 [Sporobolomyces koalae]|uniref:clathrin light chain CLC1 n=1 Tax=Sporobolomyces koalae TaxID=500713 RepID=UPI00316B8CB8